jgi:branched-chain amino acid transport system substrate-binding protein
MITPTATADRIEEIGHFVRRTCFNDSYQGKILGDYAWKTQKVKNVAVVSVADCAYCQSLRMAFKERFEALGGKVAVDQTILSSDTKFDEVIEALKEKKVDAIFIPNYERVSATIISTLIDAGIKPRLWLGGDGWGNSVDLFYRIVGKRKFKAYTISHWHRDIDRPKSKAFFAEFTKRYGKAPVDTAVLAYEAAELLIQALINTSNFSREGILEAVEKIKTFEGVTGKLVYPASARTPSKPAVLLKLENGQLSVERIIGG